MWIKELQKWPLTTIRRWAASKNSFSLDFGNFEDNTYSVLTSESEMIAQLVSGYIELILSKVSLPWDFEVNYEENWWKYETIC